MGCMYVYKNENAMYESLLIHIPYINYNLVLEISLTLYLNQ